MKSPWKFLVQLASRGRTTETPEGMDDNDTAKTNEAAPAQDEILSARYPGDDIAPPLQDADDVADDVDAKAAASDAVEAASNSGPSTSADLLRPDDRKLSTERALPSERLPVRQTRARETRRRSDAVVDAAEGASAPPVRFVDEVALLDEEINQLRRQLAAKLSLQNAQLRRMLERFDAS